MMVVVGKAVGDKYVTDLVGKETQTGTLSAINSNNTRTQLIDSNLRRHEHG